MYNLRYMRKLMKLNKRKMLTIGLSGVVALTPVIALTSLTSCSNQKIDFTLIGAPRRNLKNHFESDFVFEYKLVNKEDRFEILEYSVSNENLCVELKSTEQIEKGHGKITMLIGFKDKAFPPKGPQGFDLSIATKIVTKDKIFLQTYIFEELGIQFQPPTVQGSIELASSANVDVTVENPSATFKFKISKDFPTSHFILTTATNRNENLVFDGADGEEKYMSSPFGGREDHPDEDKNSNYFEINLKIKTTSTVEKGTPLNFSGLNFTCYD